MDTVARPQPFLLQLTQHCDRVVLRRSLAVAAVVGPILVLINQGAAVIADSSIDAGKAALTVLVPFVVSCLSGSLAGRHGTRQARVRERELADSLTPVANIVEQVHDNALAVNSTAKARYDETSALLERARHAVASMRGGAALVQTALDASADVQRQFELVLETEGEVRAEIAASSVSANSVSLAIAGAHERLQMISNLAFEIERIGQQTTLLSLNAAVVSASAGAEGKRFAAIAEAIRELARETAAQAKAVHGTAAELRASAAQMAEEAAQLAGGMQRLLTCSERASAAVNSAAGSMARAEKSTHASLQLLSSQSTTIREIADGIGRVVDHAGAAIEGSARNVGLAREMGSRLRALVAASDSGSLQVVDIRTERS